MSRYNFGRKSWKNPDSKYAYAPDNQLDIDLQTHMRRRAAKKQLIREIVVEQLESDPVKQEETYEIFVEILREYREGVLLNAK